MQNSAVNLALAYSLGYRGLYVVSYFEATREQPSTRLIGVSKVGRNVVPDFTKVDYAFFINDMCAMRYSVHMSAPFVEFYTTTLIRDSEKVVEFSSITPWQSVAGCLIKTVFGGFKSGLLIANGVYEEWEHLPLSAETDIAAYIELLKAY